jgi:beta-galactosidase
MLLDQVALWYRPLWERNLAVDFVHPERDLSRYRLVVAPNLYLVSDAAVENLERFVTYGGTLAVSFFSGIVDECDQVRLGGYPAPFRRLLGIVVPEFWPHSEDDTRHVRLDGKRYSCELWSDSIELEDAEAVAVFDDGWLAGRPAVTRKGSAWYVGTRLDAAGMAAIVGTLAEESGAATPLAVPRGVEVVRREGDGRAFLFLLNHGAEEASVELDRRYSDVLTGAELSGTLRLEPFGVAVLRP